MPALPLGRHGVGRLRARTKDLHLHGAEHGNRPAAFTSSCGPLPHILDARPDARALIDRAGNEVSYGKASAAKGGYRAEMEREVGDRVDWDRGAFPRQGALCRLPTDHPGSAAATVYLTVPFVLSWSCMESMSMGATIVASDTGPRARGDDPPPRGNRAFGGFPRSRGPGTSGHRRSATSGRVRRSWGRPRGGTLVETYDFTTQCLPEASAPDQRSGPQGKTDRGCRWA